MADSDLPSTPKPNLREILPNLTDKGHAQAARVIAEANAGRIIAIEVWTRQVIGEMPVGDGSGPVVTVYAEETGVSRSSGGLVYEPMFIRLPFPPEALSTPEQP